MVLEFKEVKVQNSKLVGFSSGAGGGGGGEKRVAAVSQFFVRFLFPLWLENPTYLNR